ncbi:MAG: ASCH domain-containing protein [Paracoccaceae bacterium]
MTSGSVLDRYPGADMFKFGDGPELCQSLIALVRSGSKRATCGALDHFVEDETPIPSPGQFSVALDWDGTPELVIQTVSVEQCKFCEVEADFALAEGENDTLEGWQRDHAAYFARNGGFDPEMVLICERFELVEDLRKGFCD